MKKGVKLCGRCVNVSMHHDDLRKVAQICNREMARYGYLPDKTSNLLKVARQQLASWQAKECACGDRRMS